MANQGDRIHQAVHAAIRDWDFPLVSFDVDTGERTTSTTDFLRAKTVLVREVSANFVDAVAYRRTPRVRERSEWIWEADVAFSDQVSLESFEEANGSLFLPRTAELAHQVTISLTQVEYTHPPEQASSSGTRATLTFSASLSRK